MRILYLSPGLFDKGGIARYGRYQVQALRDAGHALSVFSLMGRRPDDFETPFAVAWAGDAVLRKRTRVRFSAAAALAAARTRPQLVWTGHLNLGPLGWLLARTAGAKLVQNVYGREVWSPLTKARRRALAHADRVVSDCHNTAERALELGLLEHRAEVVWDCVDLERFTPGPRSAEVAARYGVRPASGGLTVVFLARLNADTRYKGSERLLELLSRLPTDVRAVFAGKGDDVEHLRARAGALGLGARVSFTGAVAEADMTDVYRLGDAFFLVSEVGPRMGEGIPLTPLEAMACGVPVLVGDQDGSRETLASGGGGGWCGAPRDLDGQAQYLLRLRDDARFLKSERLAARARAEQAFGYAGFLSATTKLVTELGELEA